MKQDIEHIDKLITKLLSGTATPDEEERLADWLAEDNQHLEQLESIIDTVAEVETEPANKSLEVRGDYKTDKHKKQDERVNQYSEDGYREAAEKDMVTGKFNGWDVAGIGIILIVIAIILFFILR